MYVFPNGTLKLSGNPEISGNTGGNIYLDSESFITVTGALTNNTPIGVTMSDPGVFTKGSTNSLKASDYIGRFTSESSNYTVVTSGNELGLQHNAHRFIYSALSDKITATCNESGICSLTDEGGNKQVTFYESSDIDYLFAHTLGVSNRLKGSAGVAFYAT